MASGKPIIATDVDEAFLVEEAQSGIIVPRNPKEFANAIIKLVDNENLLRRFGENGRKFAEKYSSDEVAKQYIKIFEDILDY
jgi:glycosyltransferase involved in cell wall biosynthesis